MTPSRVLILDSQRAVSGALAVALHAEHDFEVVKTVHTVEAAATVLGILDVDILLLDAELLRGDGVDIIRELLLRRSDRLPIVVMTDIDDSRLATEAVRAGVSSWVPKRLGLQNLMSVLRGARNGESWFPPPLLGAVLADLARPQPSPAEEKISTLTSREREILQCMVNGFDRTAIARRLFLSSNTVRTHIQNLLGKLDVHSAQEAVALAARAGISGDEAPDARPFSHLNPHLSH
ncbi:response regulator transcription factor [Frankia sp. Cj3]|uniref:LuxR C-terminal-related transcriptional regulator n=1 Tax=Frankia sp. Cj3 TaxID=2880976 RepID=UPI001EF595AC|nr:response regulator transcription factor [Frankia sp. Cj3]